MADPKKVDKAISVALDIASLYFIVFVIISLVFSRDFVLDTLSEEGKKEFSEKMLAKLPLVGLFSLEIVIIIVMLMYLAKEFSKDENGGGGGKIA